MNTREKIRFSEAVPVISAISDICGVEILEIDTNARIGLGSFSKARTKIHDFYKVIELVKGFLATGEKSDFLIMPAKSMATGWGWQAWERRRNKNHRRRTPQGSFMPKQSYGSGRIYLV